MKGNLLLTDHFPLKQTLKGVYPDLAKKDAFLDQHPCNITGRKT